MRLFENDCVTVLVYIVYYKLSLFFIYTCNIYALNLYAEACNRFLIQKYVLNVCWKVLFLQILFIIPS